MHCHRCLPDPSHPLHACPARRDISGEHTLRSIPSLLPTPLVQNMPQGSAAPLLARQPEFVEVPTARLHSRMRTLVSTLGPGVDTPAAVAALARLPPPLLFEMLELCAQPRELAARVRGVGAVLQVCGRPGWARPSALGWLSSALRDPPQPFPSMPATYPSVHPSSCMGTVHVLAHDL
eukprot:351204-Chlamydomonas_euryale.AAC.14